MWVTYSQSIWCKHLTRCLPSSEIGNTYLEMYTNCVSRITTLNDMPFTFLNLPLYPQSSVFLSLDVALCVLCQLYHIRYHCSFLSEDWMNDDSKYSSLLWQYNSPSFYRMIRISANIWKPASLPHWMTEIFCKFLIPTPHFIKSLISRKWVVWSSELLPIAGVLWKDGIIYASVR